MAVEEEDPVSGQKTTGHEWNGIKELDTPVPLGVLMFLVVTHVWALLCVVPGAGLSARARPTRRGSSVSTSASTVEASI